MDKWLKKIVKGPNPILAMVCEEVRAGEELSWLDELERVARKCKAAVGLAAPQIGVAKRAFFTLTADDRGSIRGRMFINPVIVAKSLETNVESEGCLSYPGVYKPIRRHDWVRMSYQGRDFSTHESLFAGFMARVIQHEVDHLEGICKVGDVNYESLAVRNDPPKMMIPKTAAVGFSEHVRLMLGKLSEMSGVPAELLGRPR